MAELVQLRIEETIPELEQMQRIGLFNRKEIKQIIRQRKAKEYRLQRRQKTKEDYLNYIKYERSLLSLIRKRREKTRNFNKKSEIDYSIAKRISKLFKAAIVRSKKDVKLWLSHIDFCKEMHWNETISGMFSRLLQIHSKDPALWVMAAKWEMEDNSAPDNARHILQRGLRFHPESKEIWREYFRMELMFADQIRKRKDTLKLQVEEEEAVIQGKIPSIVYSNAVKVIPDVTFAVSFVPICHEFDFAQSILDQIYNDIMERHPDEAETTDAFSRRSLRVLKMEWEKENPEPDVKWSLLRNKVLDIFEDAVQRNSSEKLWTFYIELCLELISTCRENLIREIVLLVLNLMQRASDENHLSEKHHVEWAKLLNSTKRKEECLEVSNKLVQKWPTIISHWLLCISLHVENESPVQMIMSIFNQSISQVQEKESLPLWDLAIKWLSLTKPSKLKDLFEHGIYMCAEVSMPLKCLYLEHVAENEDLKACRKLYKRLKDLKPLSVQFFKKIIEIEYCHSKNPPIKRLRNIYEDALLEYGTSSSVDLWLDYIKLELNHKQGTPTEVGNLYWRAVKTVNEADLFISKYSLLDSNVKASDS